MRNDNYGGNLENKLKYCHNHLVSNLEKYEIESEIIYIDWNPPKKNKSLYELIKKINKNKKIKIKVFSVKSYFHKKYKYSKSFPIMMEVADNVGFRRSEAIFSTNKGFDTTYSKKFFEFLKQKKLDEKSLSIVSRTLINFNDLKKNNLKNVKYLKKRKNLFPYPVNAIGDGIIISNKNRKILKGFYEPSSAVGFGADGRFVYQASKYFNIIYLKKQIFLKKISSKKIFINTTEIKHSKLSNFLRKILPNIPFKQKIILITDLCFGMPYIFRNGIPLGNPVIMKIYYLILRFIDFEILFKSNNWGLKNHKLPVKIIN